MPRLNRAVLVLGLFTAANAAAWLARRPPSSPYASGNVPVGHRIEEQVVDQASGRRMPLSDVALGQCTYVVIASETCSHSASLATGWAVEAMNTSDRLLPPGWHAVWVMAENTAPSPVFRGLPVQTFVSVNRYEVSQAAGVEALPFHLVLDRRGRVVLGGPGGDLEPLEAFSGDCEILSLTDR